MNSVAIRVLPVPVAPETRMTESRKKPPLHMLSSSGMPEVMRTLEERCWSSSAESGMAMMPSPGTIVNGYSPFWWIVPRNLRISSVCRRFSSSRTLRRMITLSATTSSTPKRATSPYSWVRSAVITQVTPIRRIWAAIRISSPRTVAWLAKRPNSAPSESIATRWALTDVIARSIRASSPPRS